MIIALLIVPIYLLYNLVKDKEGVLDAHSTGVCIGILLVSTLLFSAVLSLFTRAKRHEILGAAAAYVSSPNLLSPHKKGANKHQVLRRSCRVLGQCTELNRIRSAYCATSYT
jgi:hypothetical protein